MSEDVIERRSLPEPRYTYGGDDHVFVELDEAMSFDANFKAMAITQQVRRRDIDGVVEVCPANASYLLRFDPDRLHPDALIETLEEIAADIDLTDYSWDARVVEVPVLYDDPWTHEVMMNFRDNHQDPDSTDLEYSARINGYDGAEAFIEAHSSQPQMVTMMGFVPGLPWMFQMVPADRQIEVPKYVQPRTNTPSRAIGYGGAFSVVYPVQGAGGYQLFGRTPVEVLDVEQSLSGFEESMVYLNPGDIVTFRRIDRDEYDRIRNAVENDSYEYTTGAVAFEPDEFFADPYGYNERVVEEVA